MGLPAEVWVEEASGATIPQTTAPEEPNSEKEPTRDGFLPPKFALDAFYGKANGGVMMARINFELGLKS